MAEDASRLAFTRTNSLSSRSLAVQTRKVHKFYGTGQNAVHVLQGLDVDVPYGKM